MSRRHAVAALCLLLSVTPPAAAQSLWREGAMGSSLFTDPRARAVNDILTILIVESSSSSRTANTKLSESTSRKAGVTKFPTILDPVTGKLVAPVVDPVLGYQRPSEVFRQRLNLELGAEGAHEGKGNIDRTDRVTGQIAARVVKVLDNGNFVIEGRRAVLVNDDTQIITISGVVRPQDITGGNTVLSSQLADAEVQMVGRGVLAEAQKPGILYRILDWLRLF
jgi:flagellar L-ring protein precursor FlgH